MIYLAILPNRAPPLPPCFGRVTFAAHALLKWRVFTPPVD